MRKVIGAWLTSSGKGANGTIATNPTHLVTSPFPMALTPLHPIPHLEVTEARKLLGAMIRPDGNQTNQFKFLLSKVVRWADAICSKHIAKQDAWYCLNHTTMKTMEYPLMATALSRKQCEDFMKPILKVGLAPRCVASNAGLRHLANCKM